MRGSLLGDVLDRFSRCDGDDGHDQNLKVEWAPGRRSGRAQADAKRGAGEGVARRAASEASAMAGAAGGPTETRNERKETGRNRWRGPPYKWPRRTGRTTRTPG